jgi:hypothetical protein
MLDWYSDGSVVDQESRLNALAVNILNCAIGLNCAWMWRIQYNIFNLLSLWMKLSLNLRQTMILIHFVNWKTFFHGISRSNERGNYIWYVRVVRVVKLNISVVRNVELSLKTRTYSNFQNKIMFNWAKSMFCNLMCR